MWNSLLKAIWLLVLAIQKTQQIATDKKKSVFFLFCLVCGCVISVLASLVTLVLLSAYHLSHKENPFIVLRMCCGN